jgi:hypothetical protein
MVTRLDRSGAAVLVALSLGSVLSRGEREYLSNAFSSAASVQPDLSLEEDRFNRFRVDFV